MRDEQGDQGEQREDGREPGERAFGAGVWPLPGGTAGPGDGEAAATAAGSKLGAAAAGAVARGGPKAGAGLGSAVAASATVGGGSKAGVGLGSAVAASATVGGGSKVGVGLGSAVAGSAVGGGSKAGVGLGSAAAGSAVGGGPKVGSQPKARPRYKAPWHALKGAVSGKAAVAIVGLVLVGAVGTGGYVLATSDGKSTEDVATAADPGSGDPDGEDGQDEGLVPGTDDKAGDGTTTTTMPEPTTTTSSAGPASPADPSPASAGGVGTTPPTPSTSTTTTTAVPAGPAPDIQRFVADWDSSGTVRCAGLTYATIFRWTAQDATSASLGPASGGDVVTDLPASGSQVLCAGMGEVWRLTATGAGGTDTATARTPYLG